MKIVPKWALNWLFSAHQGAGVAPVCLAAMDLPRSALRAALWDDGCVESIGGEVGDDDLGEGGLRVGQDPVDRCGHEVEDGQAFAVIPRIGGGPDEVDGTLHCGGDLLAGVSVLHGGPFRVRGEWPCGPHYF